MAKVHLSDIFMNPITGEWGESPGDDEVGSPVIRTTNFTNEGVINYDDIAMRSIDRSAKENKLLQPSDIIIEKSGGSPTTPVGRVVYFDGEEKKYFVNNFTSILRTREGFCSKYLLYLLLYFHKVGVVLKFQNKTTGIINLKLRDYLETTFINIPSHSVQENTAFRLDLLKNLIVKRQEQMEALDDLVESVLHEMLGCESVNMVKLGDVFEIKSGSTPARKDLTFWNSKDIPWIKSTEVKGTRIKESAEYITEKAYNQVKLLLNPVNTVLIAMYGQGKTRGQVGMLGIEATTNQAVAALLPNTNVNMNYIFYLLKQNYQQLRDISLGGNQQNLSVKLLKKFEITLPPIALQNRFADIVRSIEEDKEKLKVSLEELETLFDALMQEAFSGNLV